MSKDQKRKGQSKLAFPLGLVIIIFAIVGVIFAVGSGIDGIKNLTDNSEKKIEYETMLIPVVMYDPDMFDDVSSANLDQLTVCAVWGIIKDEDNYPGKYETDDQGNIMIPAEDVEKNSLSFSEPMLYPHTSASRVTLMNLRLTSKAVATL